MTRTRQTVTASVMRAINRSAVLEIIRQNSPISRTRIAQLLHASLPTVMRSVDDLIADGLVRQSGLSETSGGRPSPLLAFNGEDNAVIGVNLGGKRIYAAAADLSGKVLRELRAPIHADQPEDNLTQLVEAIRKLLAATTQTVRGIAIGVPGITRFPDGEVTWAPTLGWRDLPLRARLEKHFDLPVLVENDVNLATLGESGFGAGKGSENLVLIWLEAGLGAGVLINGRLHRGHHMAAGEIGYLLPGVAHLGRQYGTFGALETEVSLSGMVARAGEMLRQAGEVSEQPLSETTVFAAAARGERWACNAVEDLAAYLSLAIASAVCLVDPELILLGGSIAAHAPCLIAPIRRQLEGALPALPPLSAASLGERAVLMGSICLIFNGTLDNTLHRHP